jgi:hypothetical protein
MIHKFDYNGKAREVFVLEDEGDSLKGIDLGLLNESLRMKFGADMLKIKDGVEDALKPFMQAFRHFKKSRIQENSELE